MNNKEQEYINRHAFLEAKLYHSKQKKAISFFQKIIDKIIDYFK